MASSRCILLLSYISFWKNPLIQLISVYLEGTCTMKRIIVAVFTVVISFFCLTAFSEPNPCPSTHHAVKHGSHKAMPDWEYKLIQCRNSAAYQAYEKAKFDADENAIVEQRKRLGPIGPNDRNFAQISKQPTPALTSDQQNNLQPSQSQSQPLIPPEGQEMINAIGNILGRTK